MTEGEKTKGSKKKQYLYLLVASIFSSIIYLIVNKTIPSEAYLDIASIIAVGLFLYAISALIMRAASVAAGWLSLIIMSFLLIYGSWNHEAGDKQDATVASKPAIFQGKGCEFSVTFPGVYTRKTKTHSRLGVYESAQWLKSKDERTNIAILGSYCIPYPADYNQPSPSDMKQLVLAHLEEYVKDNGLSTAEYTYKESNLGPSGMVSGVKDAQEGPVTVQMKLVLGNKSLISLYASGVSKSYPHKEIAPFLESVKVAQ